MLDIDEATPATYEFDLTFTGTAPAAGMLAGYVNVKQYVPSGNPWHDLIEKALPSVAAVSLSASAYAGLVDHFPASPSAIYTIPVATLAATLDQIPSWDDHVDVAQSFGSGGTLAWPCDALSWETLSEDAVVYWPSTHGAESDPNEVNRWTLVATLLRNQFSAAFQEPIAITDERVTMMLKMISLDVAEFEISVAAIGVQPEPIVPTPPEPIVTISLTEPVRIQLPDTPPQPPGPTFYFRLPANPATRYVYPCRLGIPLTVETADPVTDPGLLANGNMVFVLPALGGGYVLANASGLLNVPYAECTMPANAISGPAMVFDLRTVLPIMLRAPGGASQSYFDFHRVDAVVSGSN